MVNLHSRGWLRRTWLQTHTPQHESTAPAGGLCLDNWPAKGAAHPALRPTPEEVLLEGKLGNIQKIFVSVAVVRNIYAYVYAYAYAYAYVLVCI